VVFLARDRPHGEAATQNFRSKSMSEPPRIPKPPLFLLSKIIAFTTSSILYSGLLMLVYFVGCQGFLSTDDNSPVGVEFVEMAPRTLEEEKKGGNEPDKPPEPVEEIIPPRPAPEKPVTVVRADEDELIPSAPKLETTRIVAQGVPGTEGTGIIGDRSKGGREDGIARHGGSLAAENSVKAALRWLAAHQDRDGKWSAKEFTRHCPPGDSCGGRAPRQHSGLPGTYDVGVTGLALLAFLGHGNTHHEGEHREVVSRGIDYLLGQQDGRSGAFTRGERTSMYNQGIAALCLAEAYAMSKDPKLRMPVIRALGYIFQAQQKYGGWDYTQFKTNRNDTSVTGWQVMALKSAHAAGIDIPWQTTYGVMRHFERVTDEDGYVGYTSARTSRQGVALVAVGMLSNLYMGMGGNHPTVRRQTAIMLQDLPAWHKLRGSHGRDHSMYYWYYGTLAMYQKGGPAWDKWNNAIRDMLVRAQCTKGHRRGSWDGDGYWARAFAGRVYATALMALTLEVYYRYLPLYESKDTLGVGSALVEQLHSESNPTQKLAILRKLVLFKDPAVPGLLKELLSDDNPTVRFSAAKHLAERGEPAAIPFLEKGLSHADDFYRFNAIRSLEELDHIDTIGPLIRALNDPLEANANRAARALQRKTGVRFGLDTTKDPTERAKIVASWQTWWQNNREKLGALPDIQGSVVAARAGGTRVLIKVRQGDAVKKDMLLKVFRQGNLVGHLKILEVLLGGMAEGTVTHWELRGSSIRQGDQVATKRPAEGDTVD